MKSLSNDAASSAKSGELETLNGLKKRVWS